MKITLYDRPTSGHCHRVRLFLSILEIDYDKSLVDTRSGEDRTPEYRALNPLGQVPTLVDGEAVIADSTAILVYLAKRYGDDGWLPEDPAGAAAVQRWLSTASGELYRGPALCRAAKRLGREIDVAAAESWARRLFDWMQEHLADRTWLATDRATIGDIAMYTYIRVADEGDLDITPYPAIGRWLADVEQLEGFEPMPRSR